jgi:hypothetical protein
MGPGSTALGAAAVEADAAEEVGETENAPPAGAARGAMAPPSSAGRGGPAKKLSKKVEKLKRGIGL